MAAFGSQGIELALGLNRSLVLDQHTASARSRVRVAQSAYEPFLALVHAAPLALLEYPSAVGLRASSVHPLD